MAKEHSVPFAVRMCKTTTSPSWKLSSVRVKATKLLRLSRDVLMVQLFLMCGLATNPGPVKLPAFRVRKPSGKIKVVHVLTPVAFEMPW